MIKTPLTHGNHHTVGKVLKSYEGKYYYCDSYDSSCGYWLTPLSEEDERKNISERAIDRTFWVQHSHVFDQMAELHRRVLYPAKHTYSCNCKNKKYEGLFRFFIPQLPSSDCAILVNSNGQLLRFETGDELTETTVEQAKAYLDAGNAPKCFNCTNYDTIEVTK